MRPSASNAQEPEPPDTAAPPSPQLESVGAIEVPVPPEDQPRPHVEEDEHYSAFTKNARIFVVVFASVSGVMSPFAINIYMPAVPEITKDLRITDSQTLLSITTYMIFQGLTPSFWAPLSDSYGRRPILIMAFVVFLIANLGLSFTQAYWLLLVLRMLQASGASSAISIGAGCISDVSRRKERGTYMGFFQMGTLLGPAIGPIVGGLVAHRWDWHAVFFFLSALGGGYLVFMVLMLPESLRALVGDGSLRPYGIWRTLIPLHMVDDSLEGTDAEKTAHAQDEPTAQTQPAVHGLRPPMARLPPARPRTHDPELCDPLWRLHHGDLVLVARAHQRIPLQQHRGRPLLHAAGHRQRAGQHPRGQTTRL